MDLSAPIRVVIVEDQISTRQKLESFLKQQPGFIVTGACDTVYEAIKLIHTLKPDLVLLDIGLPDGTGLDILKQLPAGTKVIFLTAHSEFAIPAFRLGAIDYLLKPIDENELSEALQKVSNAQPLLREQINITLQSLKKKKLPKRIALRSQQFVQVVKFKRITFFHVDNGCTTAFLRSGKQVVTTKTLKEYEEILSGQPFLRTHQSYLVNELYIDRYHPKENFILLKDGTKIPVSDRRKEMIDLHFKTL